MTVPILDVNITWTNGDTTGGSTTGGRAAFSLNKGITALIGPSGAGKTTLAKTLAGIGPDHTGTIRFETAEIGAMKAEHRRIGYVPQSPTLFPHLTVRRNILFGARDKKALAPLADRLGITDLLPRMPATLSGGEARRVAIARALVAKPRFILFDEPTAGLDPISRRRTLSLIRSLVADSGLSGIVTTHHLDDMLHVADHGILMENQQVTLSGGIEDVLEAHSTHKALGIDDAGSVLTGTVAGHDHGLIKTDIGGQVLWLSGGVEETGGRVRLRIRARDVAIATGRPDNISINNILEATIRDITFHGEEVTLLLGLSGGGQIRAKITRRSCTELSLAPGQACYALIKSVAVWHREA